MNVLNPEYDFYSDIDVSVPIPATLSHLGIANVSKIDRQRFLNLIFELHGNVFDRDSGEKNVHYKETSLFWQGLAVYYTIAAVKHNDLVYNHLKCDSETDARAFSASICQWALSQLSVMLKGRNRVTSLSLTEKYFLWADLLALNQLLCKEERGFLEALAVPEQFSRLKSFFKFHVEALGEVLDGEIDALLPGVSVELQPACNVKPYGNILWLEHLHQRWRMTDTASRKRICYISAVMVTSNECRLPGQ
jgi:hypothetical protein